MYFVSGREITKKKQDYKEKPQFLTLNLCLTNLFVYMSSPTGVKSQPNSREGFTPWGKTSTDSWAKNSQWGMACQNLGHHLPHRGMTI
jgi:hypothetical protein